MTYYNNICNIYFDSPNGESPKEGYLSDKEYIDFSCGKENRYVNYDSSWWFEKYGYKNSHHLQTKYLYGEVLPKINKKLNFGYKRSDFKKINMVSCGGEYDVSYLFPKKNDKNFIVRINDAEYRGTFPILMDLDSNIGDTPSLYHKLFIGAHNCCTIINEGENNGKSLIVSADSMIIPTIPVLANYYQYIVHLDNRNGKTHKEWFENLLFDDCLMEFYGGVDDMKNPIKKININFT